MSKADQDIKTIREHLMELRTRLFWVALVFGVGAAIGFAGNQSITNWLVKPLGQSLYFSTPSGGLDFIFSISCIVGLLVALPIIIYQIVEFIRPAHSGLQSLKPLRIVLLSTSCAALGVSYAYFIGIPAALHFLINFAGDDVKPLLNATSYMNFIITYLAGAALVFQIPLLVAIRNKISPLKPGGLSKLQRPVILGAVIGAGIITPTPDPVNQMMLAFPLIILFQCTALYFWQKRLSDERKARRRATTPVMTPAPVAMPAEAPQPAMQTAPQTGTVGTYAFVPPSSDSIQRVRPSILRLAKDEPEHEGLSSALDLDVSAQHQKPASTSVFYDIRPPMHPAG